MNAEIITIGDELLLGQVIDTNSAWMGLQLADIGISVDRRTAIGDSESAIISAIAEARTRCNLILLTGGLGPTRDDITKKTLCTYFNCGLRRDEEVMRHLEAIFEKRGRRMLEINMQQADMPEKCTTLFNAVGTAPGMRFEEGEFTLISVPGVPSEMMHILSTHVFGWLPEKYELPAIVHKTLLTAGIPESLLSEKLTTVEDQLPVNFKLAYLPAFNSIRLRLTGIGKSKDLVEKELLPILETIKSICAENLVADYDTDMAGALAQKLLQRNTTISLAESCTGGYIANAGGRNRQLAGIQTLITDEASVQTQADKAGELYNTARFFWSFSAVMSLADLLTIEPGDRVELYLPVIRRFGLGSIKTLEVISIEFSFVSNIVRFVCSGGPPIADSFVESGSGESFTWGDGTPVEWSA